MAEWIAAVLLVAGAFFCFAAGVGVLRFKDTFQRMHASSKAGSLGLALCCLGVMAIADTWQNVAEALFVFLFMIATAPIGAHLVGRAAFRTRTMEAPDTRHDEGTDAFRAPRATAPTRDIGSGDGMVPERSP
jgi:multicomponent Na+:H+ antiporter subunit G